MRPELEEIQYIEDYLLNKLSKEKKAELELRMQTDHEFAQKVEAQRILIQRVRHLSSKRSVAIAHRSYMNKQHFPFKLRGTKSFFMSIFSLSLLVIIGYLVWESDEINSETEKDPSISVFQIPISGVDVPFINQRFDADSGAVLYFPSGSMVRIAPGILCDKNGEAVHGMVELKFREFHDAADIFIAGIPMDFEHLGNEIFLESAAMSEIYAFKDNKLLKINKGKKIEIIQSSFTVSTDFNLYRFDNQQAKWMERGKDNPVDLAIEIEGGEDEAPKSQTIGNEQNQELQLDKNQELARRLNKQRILILDKGNKNEIQQRIISIEPTEDDLIKNKNTIEQEYDKVLQNIDLMEASSKTIRRAYSIEVFGLWNSDQPIATQRQMVKATFELDNKKLEVKTIYLAVSETRTILNFSKSNMEQFGYYQGSGNTILTIVEANKLAYYEKFSNLPLSVNSNQYTFKMKKYPMAIVSYEQARTVINSLFER